jgi:hypothetical protein
MYVLSLRPLPIHVPVSVRLFCIRAGCSGAHPVGICTRYRCALPAGLSPFPWEFVRAIVAPVAVLLNMTTPCSPSAPLRFPVLTTPAARLCSASAARLCAGKLALHIVSAVRGCGALAASPSDSGPKLLGPFKHAPSILAPGPFGDATASSQGGSPQDHEWWPSPVCPTPLRSVACVRASWPCTWPRPCVVVALRQPSILASGPLGDATASSRGDSPIKTTGGGPLQGSSLRLGRSLLCSPDFASLSPAYLPCVTTCRCD